jgi:hypothetical protein
LHGCNLLNISNLKFPSRKNVGDKSVLHVNKK